MGELTFGSGYGGDSVCVWRGVGAVGSYLTHVNTVRDVMVWDVYFLFPKIL